MKKQILCVAISVLILFPAAAQEVEPCIQAETAILLNLLPGFGLGSFLQGDVGGGLIQLFLESFSVILMIATIQNPSGAEFGFMTTLGIEGTLCLLGTTFFIGCRRPPRYERDRRFTRSSSKVTFGIFPVLEPWADRKELNAGVEVAVRYAPDRKRYE